MHYIARFGQCQVAGVLLQFKQGPALFEPAACAGARGQALELVSDVHVLADRVRVKVTGAKTPERGALISPRPSGHVPPAARTDEQTVSNCPSIIEQGM